MAVTQRMRSGSGERCKAKWNNPRHNYIKGETESVDTEKYVNPYRFADRLNFLHRYFRDRETKGNSVLSASDDSGSEDDKDQYSLARAELQSRRQGENNTGTGNISDKSDISTRRRYCKKTNLEAQPTASSIMMRYIIEKCSRQGSNTPNQAATEHPVDAFLRGISPMLKSLSPYFWHLAKSEIFATAQKYEMLMLTKQTASVITFSEESTFHPSQPAVTITEKASTVLLSSTSCPATNYNEDNLQIVWQSFGRNST